MTDTKLVFPENLGFNHVGVVVKARTEVSLGVGGETTLFGVLEAIEISTESVKVRIGDTWFSLNRSVPVEVQDW